MHGRCLVSTALLNQIIHSESAPVQYHIDLCTKLPYSWSLPIYMLKGPIKIPALFAPSLGYEYSAIIVSIMHAHLAIYMCS